MKKTEHLPHVQGLRGIAVLAVVLYHSGLPINGGYLGVDIFFVISGYVVTLNTQQQISESQFSLNSFYSRRIRRLIPLLTLVNVVTIALCLMFMSLFGDIQKAFSTVQWSSLFGANIQLLQENSYTQLTGNPFRHLWSLAVEEQFYFLFPLIVLAAIRISKMTKKYTSNDWLGVLVLALLLISLSHYLLITQNNLNEASLKYAFFSLTPRFWEFSFGVLLAIYSNKLARITALSHPIIQISASISLLLSLTLLQENHQLPRAILLIPVVATTGLLLFGGTGKLGSVLSYSPLTHLGDLSYGWYLWHWPLIVFADTIFPQNILVAIAISVFALLLSRITYNRVENPFRRNYKIHGFRAAALLASSILVINVSVTGAHAIANIVRNELLPRDQVWDGNNNHVLDQCFLGEQYKTWIFKEPKTISELCSWPQNTRSRSQIFAIGDSHMASYSGGLMTAASAMNYDITLYGAAGCPPVLAPPKASIEFCGAMHATFINAIIALRPSVVVLSGRTSLYSSRVIAFNDKEMQVPFLNGIYPSEAPDFIDSYIDQLDRTVSFAIKYGAKVIITLEPQIALLSAQTLLEQYFPGLISNSDTDSADRIKTREQIRAKVNERFSNNPDVLIFDPELVLCADRNYCLAYQNGEPMYSDDNHISMSGSLLFTEKWKQILEEALTNSG
jgi:peptidoglycan/LPS O-acetylase OafA/YrhL